MFEALYIDNKDFTLEPYLVRQRALEKTLKESTRLCPAKHVIVSNVKDLEKFFEEAIADGCEGIVGKDIGKDSTYQAGARGWLWIKYKRDYKSEMKDTVDLVVVGAFHGRGKRAGTYGALLLATYNKKADTFETVTKRGTGFTDKDLKELPELLRKHEIPRKHSRVQSMLEADVWFEPAVVLEVLGAGGTVRPFHL